MKKKILLITIPLLLVGLFALLRISASMDRVDQHFGDSSQLPESALSWIPFDKNFLDGAKDISLSTDVDTNQFVIRWKYLDSVAMDAFRKGASKISTKNESIDCEKEHRSECSAINKSKGLLELYEVPQEVGVFKKSFWLLEPDTNIVLGATQIPLPPHLK